MTTPETRFLGIDGFRFKHMREVGTVCAELAERLFGWDESKCRQMFLLGYLHDIGYQYSADQLEHEAIGGAILADAGFQFADAVRDHGNPDVFPMSPELLILNIADMSVNRYGERVSFEDRLADISSRYGEESVQYVKAAELVHNINDELRMLGKSL